MKTKDVNDYAVDQNSEVEFDKENDRVTDHNRPALYITVSTAYSDK